MEMRKSGGEITIIQSKHNAMSNSIHIHTIQDFECARQKSGEEFLRWYIDTTTKRRQISKSLGSFALKRVLRSNQKLTTTENVAIVRTNLVSIGLD